MMQFTYNTKRLNLHILSGDDAYMVLEFYQRNKEIFEIYEPLHDAAFYTNDYQSFNLEAEMKLFLKSQRLRYYLFKRGNSKEIIGTISFSNIISQPFNSCSIGYKIDKNHQRMGYAAEAVNCLIPLVMNELRIARIEANIMPSNIPSIRLIESLGFTYEGISRSLSEIRGSRFDHLRFSLLDTDVFSKS